MRSWFGVVAMLAMTACAGGPAGPEDVPPRAIAPDAQAGQPANGDAGDEAALAPVVEIWPDAGAADDALDEPLPAFMGTPRQMTDAASLDHGCECDPANTLFMTNGCSWCPDRYRCVTSLGCVAF